MLYACSQRAGAFVETLAPFRADLSLVAELAEIDGPDLDRAPGVVPWTWLGHRSCGEAVVSGRFSDVGAASSLALLRQALASDAIAHGLQEIDGAAIRSSAPRGFTQRLSRFVHDWKDPDGQFDGIRYVSRWGNEFVNWAIFEPAEGKTSPVQSTTSDLIQADDVELQEALRILNLTFG